MLTDARSNHDDDEDDEAFNIDSLFNNDEERTSVNKNTHKHVSKNKPNAINDQEAAIVTDNGQTQQRVNIKNSCAETLANANNLFDGFIVELDKLCIRWKELPIEQLLIVFPDVGSVESDMLILKEFLHADVVPHLRFIFTFWKNRKYLHDVCFGFNKLFERCHISSNTDFEKRFADLTEINNQTISSECYNKYQHYVETIENIYSRNILNLCAKYNVSKELIKFLEELTTTDADNLLEAVNDWDETLISTKSVIDFVKLKTFFTRAYASIEELRSHKAELLFQDVAKCFDDIFKDDDFKNVIGLFETCSQSVAGIKHLYLELTNKEQSKRRYIIDIMSHSLLHFVKNLGSERLFDVQIKSKNLTFDDLSELRDRARLIQYSNAHKKNQDHNLEIQKLESFVELVGVIEGVLKNLSSLYIAGFPTVTEIINNQGCTCNEGNYDDLRHLYATLEEKLSLWERQLCQMYEIYPELTYFSYEQFQTVESFIYNVKFDEKHPGYHLLKYIGFEPALLQQVELPTKSADENKRLENLGKILTTQRSVSDDLEEMKEDSIVHTIRLVETIDDGILRAAFSLFDMVKKPIHAHQLFYCAKRTTWMEIRAFIYRCFFSKKYQVLIRPDLLPLLIQDKFLPLLNNLIEDYPTRPFRLGIITTKTASHIQLINAIKTRININILHDQKLLCKDDLTSQIQNLLHQCTIVTSRLSGSGKSQFIEKESHRLGKQLIKFPIGGDIKADEIADRLRILHDKSLKTSILHLDIGHVENVYDLDELLYCLTLFRSFCFGQSAVHVPSETLFYIELASSPYIKINERLLLCQYLKPVYLNEVNWDELDCNSPRIQFVAKYLNAIDTSTITKENIKLDDEKVIDRTTCMTLIQKHFLQNKNLEFVTWTQLCVFMSVFYSLFNGFSICGYFLVEFVDQPQLRLDILQALLRSSNQFTSVSVEKVRQQQRASLIDDPETHQPELTDAIVRWENTQPFTLVFTATHDPLFVYKTINDIPQSLRNYFNDFQQIVSQRTTQKAKSTITPLNNTVDNILSDYNKLSHVELFQKLASLSYKYFNKAVCIKCFKQYPYKTQQCTQCHTNENILRPETLDNCDVLVFQTKIANLLEAEYVLTPDNYVKMLLIYMRIQSGLPVLIMGETGKSLVIYVVQRHVT
ncbi:unnamed protein product [Rotaria sp. Silwood2]|nr:unnamed protein product [Rotaria sp. Silwood2]CAF3035309.1 unnamed protein product [Rotaria sp. Silwood2]CAF3889486.1 unnamed protein product [Rotaria sp. Silwood2]CAF4207221.1 unnamed protein product [Rotaria sp. Silwood2]